MDKNISIIESCFRTAGERLMHLRKAAGYLLDDVVARTSISKSELSRLENDTRAIRDVHRHALAAAYGIKRETFDGILDFDPAAGVAQISWESKEADIPREIRELPCYESETFPDKPERPKRIRLAVAIPAREKSYAVRLSEPLYDFFPERCLFVIDPEARIVVGDLVLNPARQGHLLFSIERDAAGMLAAKLPGQIQAGQALAPALRLADFHKIIAIFPAPHLVCLEEA